jgi:hypothetical protein
MIRRSGYCRELRGAVRHHLFKPAVCLEIMRQSAAMGFWTVRVIEVATGID